MILAALSPRIMQAPSTLSPHHRRAPAGHGSPRRLAAGLHSGGVGAVGVLTGKPCLGAGSRPSADGAPQQVLCGGLPSGLWPCPLGSGWLCSEGQGAGPGTGRPCPRLHDQSGRVGLRDDAPPLGRRVLNGGPGVSVLGGFRVLWQTQLSRRARSPHLRKVSDARPPCHFWFSKGPSRAHAAAGGTVPAEGGRPRRTAPPRPASPPASGCGPRPEGGTPPLPGRAGGGRGRALPGDLAPAGCAGITPTDDRVSRFWSETGETLQQAKPSRAGHSCV